jgi:RNA polymerase sigma-70 factor, ECF subfamily
MSTAALIREALLARSAAPSRPTQVLALEQRLYRAATAIIPPNETAQRGISAPVTASDEALLAAFARGDASAFEILARRHLGWMVAWAQQHLPHPEAEDAAQEAFLALVRKAAGLRLTSTLRGFLFGLLRIEVLRAKRTRHRHHAKPLDDDATGATQVPSADPSPAMEVLAQRSHGELAAAMLRVCTLREQEVLLFDLEGATDKDIAAALELSEGNVRVVRHRAITKLRAAFSESPKP